MSNFALSNNSSNSKFDISPSTSSLSSNSTYLSQQQYKFSSDEMEKIIGINQSSFIESSTPIMVYVKFKNQSYQHCKWIPQDVLLRSQRGSFLYTKFSKNTTPFRPVPLFNQMISSDFGNQSNSIETNEYQLFKPTNIAFDRGFITPEKIISIQNNLGKPEYLIKWISLDITESTWETNAPGRLIEDYKRNNSNTHPRCYDNKIDKKNHKFNKFLQSPVFKNDHKLTDYQVDALNWLQACWFQRRNSILADEMGLGKTIESISILDFLAKSYIPWGPFIVICPTSTVTNWIDEFEQWTYFRVINLLGNEKAREMIKSNLIFQYDEDKRKRNVDKIIFDVLIVSFEILPREISFIKKFNFMYMIIDEAQRLKNSKSLTYQNCLSVSAHHMLLMTGTPIQNDLSEIWSLLHFISPSEFPDYDSFYAQYENQEDPETIERLQEVLRPYIFRRKKNDVKIDIPEKEETIIEVEMTQIQRTFSQLYIKDNLDILSDISAIKINLNNVMMLLRKLFCHPFLIPKLEAICLSQYKDKHHIPYSTPLTYDDEINTLIYASGKTILIDKLLPKLKEGNHKVLIFSQLTTMLDIIEDYLVYKHYNYERLDGSCTTAKRAMSIQRFQKDEDVFVFLLSTRAGGLGINLTQADTVIIYDSDWNPQNDIQAQARCHRFGQTKKVNVYRLITRGSYESEMFLRASKKLALDFAILDSGPTQSSSSNSPLMSNSNSLNQIDEEANGSESEGGMSESHSNLEEKLSSRKELEMILKKGAYYTFKDDPNEIDKFCLENIDQILEHRAHTKKDLISGGNSRFSKVSFDGRTEEDEEEMDRSDFWDNLIGASKDDENSSDSGIKTRPKKPVNYAPEKIKKSKKDKSENKDENENDNDEYEEDQNSSSSDNDCDFIPSQPISNSSGDAKQKKQNNQQSQPQQQQNSDQQPKQQKPILQQQKPNLLLHLPSTPETIQLLKNRVSVRNDYLIFARDCALKHGILGSRFFIGDFLYEISKTLVSYAYLEIPKDEQIKFKDYINEYIPNPKKQILETPVVELVYQQEYRSLLNHQELTFIKTVFLRDCRYRTALYISNEKLPNKYIFAPEMSTPIGWTPLDDYVLINSYIFEYNFFSILQDKKLPFSSMNDIIRISPQWATNRLNLIFHEVDLMIPKDFKVTKIVNSQKVYKQFNTINKFAEINGHICSPIVLSINEQKKLLRIFYLYGIPSSRGLAKFMSFLRAKNIRKDLIVVFAIKILIKSIKYKPNLCKLLKVFPKVPADVINDNSIIDIRWIKNEAIQAVASNIDLFYRIREEFKWLNGVSNDGHDNLQSIGLSDWTEIQKEYPLWNLSHDKALFNVTAYYGFLFNSMLAKFINNHNLTDEEIIEWRENEALTLTPINHRKTASLYSIFQIERKISRLNQILDLIEIAKKKSE